MAEHKAALLIATSEYDDPQFRALRAPAQDVKLLSKVLSDPAAGGFSNVKVLVNEPKDTVVLEIEEFFDGRDPDDLLFLYFSCHGIKDEDGRLYYATRNTRNRRLVSTAVPAYQVNDLISKSRSRRKILVLDCCYSGACSKAFLAKGSTTGDVPVGALEAFEQGRGLVTLTASDAFQYSFEEEGPGNAGVCSVFTRALVDGIETGKADRDGDQLISLDELYEYAYEHVRRENPRQNPRIQGEVEGKLIVARNPQPPLPAELPHELVEAIESSFVANRENAVRELDKLLRGRNRALALAAYNALVRLKDDDSRRVANAAELCLKAYEETLLAKPPEPPVPAEPPAKETASAGIVTEPVVTPEEPEEERRPRTKPEPVAKPERPVDERRTRAKPEPAAKPEKPVEERRARTRPAPVAKPEKPVEEHPAEPVPPPVPVISPPAGEGLTWRTAVPFLIVLAFLTAFRTGGFLWITRAYGIRLEDLGIGGWIYAAGCLLMGFLADRVGARLTAAIALLVALIAVMMRGSGGLDGVRLSLIGVDVASAAIPAVMIQLTAATGALSDRWRLAIIWILLPQAMFLLLGPEGLSRSFGWRTTELWLGIAALAALVWFWTATRRSRLEPLTEASTQTFLVGKFALLAFCLLFGGLASDLYLARSIDMLGSSAGVGIGLVIAVMTAWAVSAYRPRLWVALPGTISVAAGGFLLFLGEFDYFSVGRFLISLGLTLIGINAFVLLPATAPFDRISSSLALPLALVAVISRALHVTPGRPNEFAILWQVLPFLAFAGWRVFRVRSAPES